YTAPHLPMEERVPPTGEGNDDPPPWLQPNPRPLPLPPGRSETYVVQIPRDQVYRVPPPENARIVESHHKPHEKKRQGIGGCCCWAFVGFALVLAVVTITLVVIHALFNPKSPQFSITNLEVKNTKSSHLHAHHPSDLEFVISITAKNPNEKMGTISYKSGGASSISFKQHVFAAGEYPSFSQEANNSTLVHVILAGSKEALPREIEKSMNGTKSKTPVSLAMAINVPIKITSLVITLNKELNLNVMCDFKANTLAKGTKILSQECHNKT
ncbi:unnamed protein product, partial [Ilex paraguariensis]